MAGGRDQDHDPQLPAGVADPGLLVEEVAGDGADSGSYDPAAGVGVGFRFPSVSPFSGVHDPHLDAMLNQAAATVNLSQRCTIYSQAAAYIAQQAYGPFYFAFAPANVAVKGVTGPGLSMALPAVVVTPTILWEDVATTADPWMRRSSDAGPGGTPWPRLGGLRRLLAAIPVLWGVTFLTFVVMNLLPGDAATELLGANATPAEVHQLEVKLHLNEPFWVCYGHWLGGLFTGNSARH